MDLTGQTVLVTGGSAGIGRATSLSAARNGADVVVADIRRDPRDDGEPTVNAVERMGQEAAYVNTDVTSMDDLRDAVAVAEELGGLDGMVNNAGLAESYTISETTPENWQAAIETNVTGVFNGSRAAIQAMTEKESGVIVNIGSVAGLIGLPNSASYSAAKGGVMALTRQLAVDHARKGIRVNSVSPGFIDTVMFRDDTHDGTREYAESSTPMGRIGEPTEVADTVVFLLSDAAGFITGQNVVIDGGYITQ